jgi:PAS domain S-box-containing protein
MEYRLDQILDIPLLQMLQDKLNAIIPFPSALIENSGKILTETAWQDICTKFHRVNSESNNECIASDGYILNHMHEANPAVTYRCPHGMVDNAIPIVVEGTHLGNFFTGQLFLEPPDTEFFKSQAERYGFDQESYLEAVNRVPVWSIEKLLSYLDFIKTFIETQAKMGLSRLREMEARQLLIDSEMKYRQLTELTPDGILIHVDGVIQYANNSAARILGDGDPDILIGKKLLDFVHPDYQSTVTNRVEQVSKFRNLVPIIEEKLIRLNGQVFYSEVSALHFNLGGKDAVQAVFRDISERKHAEEKVNTLAQAIHCIKECVSMTDINNDLIFVNNAFCQTFGFTEEELMGQNISIVRSPDDIAGVPTSVILSETLKGGWSGELINRRKDGTDFPVHLSTALVTDAENKVVALIGISVDISDRKKNEHELIAAKEKAQESDRLKSAFLANISHEIRSPMNSILGFSDLLIEMAEDPKELEYLKIISNGGERLLKIINSVIDIAKIEAGHENLIIVEFDVNTLLNELYELNKNRNPKLKFINDMVWKDSFPLFTDKTKLFQILNNLLSNALKYTKQGSVHFGYEKDGDSITFYVKDTGIGIPDEYKNKVFERFQKVDLHDRLDFEGTGLGLAIVKELVKILKGEIWFDSQPGVGSNFYVKLSDQAGRL